MSESEQYLSVKNWKKYQQYKHRRPPWIRLYVDLLEEYGIDGKPNRFRALSDNAASLYIAILLLAACYQNRIPRNEAWIENKTGRKCGNSLKELLDCGLIVLASNELAPCKQHAITDSDSDSDSEVTDTDTDTEEDPPYNPPLNSEPVPELAPSGGVCVSQPCSTHSANPAQECVLGVQGVSGCQDTTGEEIVESASTVICTTPESEGEKDMFGETLPETPAKTKKQRKPTTTDGSQILPGFYAEFLATWNETAEACQWESVPYLCDEHKDKIRTRMKCKNWAANWKRALVEIRERHHELYPTSVRNPWKPHFKWFIKNGEAVSQMIGKLASLENSGTYSNDIPFGKEVKK